MKIAVTGSSGRIGRYVVRELSSAGHEVSQLDIRDASMRVDLTDAGQVYGALAYGMKGLYYYCWGNGIWNVSGPGANTGGAPGAPTQNYNV